KHSIFPRTDKAQCPKPASGLGPRLQSWVPCFRGLLGQRSSLEPSRPRKHAQRQDRDRKVFDGQHAFAARRVPDQSRSLVKAAKAWRPTHIRPILDPSAAPEAPGLKTLSLPGSETRKMFSSPLPQRLANA